MREYGTDFQAIAEIIGTKTESQVSLFYKSSLKRYDLEKVIKEYEAKQQQQQQEQKQQQQQQNTNEAPINSNVASVVSGGTSTDSKTDVKKLIPDDDVMEVSRFDDDSGSINMEFCAVFRF